MPKNIGLGVCHVVVEGRLLSIIYLADFPLYNLLAHRILFYAFISA
jgi:hypothetical protein